MQNTLIKNARVVTDGRTTLSDVRISSPYIEEIGSDLSAKPNEIVIDAQGKLLLPGMIDDQVHFREPGLTHKGSIATESRAAVSGGITSFMEMPNVKPSTTTVEALADKEAIAKQHSVGNYAFYLGATESNIDEICKLDPSRHCGVKVFMGASTGDLLVEHPEALDKIFSRSPVLVVTHCEDSRLIDKNLAAYAERGVVPEPIDHPIIRDAEACYSSSSYAVNLAKKHKTQLHVLHITTEKELSLFAEGPMEGKHITAEVCVHHLWYSDKDYARLGNLIKCNPAIKKESDRQALVNALNSGRLDIIATDHAPHTFSEKQAPYPQAPAGLPLVEHALPSLFTHVKRGDLTVEQIVQKTAHNPAIRFGVDKRGYIREGYYADLVLIDPEASVSVTHESVSYLCGWTPLDGETLNAKVLSTWVNGSQVFDGTHLVPVENVAMPLSFNR